MEALRAVPRGSQTCETGTPGRRARSKKLIVRSGGASLHRPPNSSKAGPSRLCQGPGEGDLAVVQGFFDRSPEWALSLRLCLKVAPETRSRTVGEPWRHRNDRTSGQSTAALLCARLRGLSPAEMARLERA
jgi:hypothetical protein